MNVKNVEKKDDGKLSFQVEFDSAEFEAAINKAYQKAKKTIAVPGFRKGKAPRKLIESMYGTEVFYEDAINELAPDAFEEGMKDQDVKTVGMPAISNFDISDDKALTLTFEIALYPEAVLGEYKGLEVYKAPVEVSDEEVESELANVQKRNARIVSVKRKSKKGDTANIDFEGFLDGKPFEGGKGEAYDLVLGSNSFVPGFEKQVIGMKAGEEKDLDITFPEDYHEELAGKAVVFKVKVNEVKESKLPALDDEFAKDVSEFDTLDEYKADIKAKIAERKSEESDKAFRNDAVAAAAENMTVVIPEAMVDERVDGIVKEYVSSMRMQGMDFVQYLAMMGMDENTFRGIVRPNAANDVRIEVMLEKVAEVENLEATEEDVEEEYKKAAEGYGLELEKVKEAVPVEIISRDIRIKKATSLICDSAVATDKKPEEEKKDEAAAE